MFSLRKQTSFVSLSYWLEEIKNVRLHVMCNYALMSRLLHKPSFLNIKKAGYMGLRMCGWLYVCEIVKGQGCLWAEKLVTEKEPCHSDFELLGCNIECA